MDRRSLLRGGALLAGALPGCLTARDGGGTSEDTPTEPSTTPSASPTPAPTPPPTDTSTPARSPTTSPTGATAGSRLVDRSFTVRDAGCGTQRDAADATVDGPRVTVTGTIPGSDTCHTARLADVAYAGRGARLRVGIESYVPETAGTVACGQCIVEIDYEATFAFAGGRPGTVVVVHDGREVASIPLPE